MVRFTIWSSHSPQTLLMLYHRMDGMISIAGFVIGKAKSSAANSVLGFIMLSVWNWQPNQRGIGFAQNVRLVWYKEWISFLFVKYKQHFCILECFWFVPMLPLSKGARTICTEEEASAAASPLWVVCLKGFKFLVSPPAEKARFKKQSPTGTSSSESILQFPLVQPVGWAALQPCRKRGAAGPAGTRAGLLLLFPAGPRKNVIIPL